MRINKFTFMEENNGNGNDLAGGDINFDKQTSPEAQAILDGLKEENQEPNGDDDITLPSDSDDLPTVGDEEDGKDKKFAGKYNTIDDLKKGIKHIGSDLPDYILNGMNDEALEQHYTELQKNKSKEEPKDRKYQKPEENQDDGEPKDTDLNQVWTDIEEQFKLTGSVSAELYNKLEEAGIPSSVIDSHIDSVKAKQVEFTNQVLEIAGGEDKYLEIKEWAESKYSQEQLDKIVSLDYDNMLIAMQGIKAQYDKEVGSKETNIPDRLSGKPASKGSGYASKEDYIKDVSDPRYSRDERYRKAVERKLSISKLS